MTDVTRILNAIEQGDEKATEELLPLVYEELRMLAAQKLSQEKPGQTLQATALVHEAYLRLVGVEDRHWQNSRHFFRVVAGAMQRILVDKAREKKSLKRGSGRQRVDLDEAITIDQNMTQATDLLAHAVNDSFLEESPLDSGMIRGQASISEGPGTVIGRYKLLEKIGEGGMAVVYGAEQQKPMHRQVALKIIKLGMDTQQVIARFEAERQALALMDHPHIAKVLDAGATDAGRPYFVMELVKGVSITEYCDKKKMSTPARLKLFIQVCDALQHAHQKGVIHRDVKPSNVMVTQREGIPVPKVIDFGIAKAINEQLTEQTIFTRYAHIK